jgi:hypothetical protein
VRSHAHTTDEVEANLKRLRILHITNVSVLIGHNWQAAVYPSKPQAIRVTCNVQSNVQDLGIAQPPRCHERALMRTIALNLGQARSPMFAMWVTRSSVLTIVSFSSVAELKRISSASFMSINSAKGGGARFSWRSRSEFHTALEVGGSFVRVYIPRGICYQE